MARCEVHQEETYSKCCWCAQPICHVCVRDAHGHKFCERCAEKVELQVPLLKNRPRKGMIKNVDEMLSEEQLEAARAAVRKRFKNVKEKKVDEEKITNKPGSGFLHWY